MASLEERRKAGERFYLALVDPLLKKPAYFELKKQKVTVGFLRDCDWALPWTSMGIDILTDSRRFDPIFPENSCDSVYNSPRVCASEIGKREKEPLFEMKFDLNTGWLAECPQEHGCGVTSPSTLPRKLLFQRHRFDEDDERNDGTCIKALEDGAVFQFVWPDASLYRSEKGFSLPVQRLIFVFIACRKDEFAVRHHLGEGPPQLLSLPKEVLALIASYLDPEEFFSTLGAVGRIFTSALMKDRIPWKRVTLTASFDSLRIAELASAEAVREVTCESIWCRELRSSFGGKWQRIINHEHLKVLDLEDPDLLTLVGVPSQLQELKLRMMFPRKDYWNVLNILKFPSSIHRISAFAVKSNDDDDDDTDEDDGDLAPVRLSPKVFLAAFPSAVEVHLREISFVDEEWIDVSASALDKILNLFASSLKVGLSIPLHRMTNLVVLQLEGSNSLLGCLQRGALPNLEYLVIVGRHFGYNGIKAPNLRFLRISSEPDATSQSDRFFRRLHIRHPNLEFLCVKGVDFNLSGVKDLLTAMPGLKDVEFSARSAMECVPLSTFTKCPGATLRLAWYSREGRAWYDFLYSRVTDEEREEVMKPLRRETFAWY